MESPRLVGLVHGALEIAELLASWILRAVAWAAEVEASVPVPGYTDLFRQGGKCLLEAQFLATTILSLSLRMEEEHSTIRRTASLIRRVAEGRSTPNERFELLEVLGSEGAIDLRHSVLDENAPGGAFDVTRLRRSLFETAKGKATLRQVAAIAADLAPLPETRGRLRARSHYAHALLLMLAAEQQGPKAYTYDPVQSEYTDQRTIATRLAMNKPTFNPVRVQKGRRFEAARRT